MTAATNKVEAFNGFSQWIGFGNGGVITDNDPVEQEKTVKFNALLTNELGIQPEAYDPHLDVDFSPLRGNDPPPLRTATARRHDQEKSALESHWLRHQRRWPG